MHQIAKRAATPIIMPIRDAPFDVAALSVDDGAAASDDASPAVARPSAELAFVVELESAVVDAAAVVVSFVVESFEASFVVEAASVVDSVSASFVLVSFAVLFAFVLVFVAAVVVVESSPTLSFTHSATSSVKTSK